MKSGTTLRHSRLPGPFAAVALAVAAACSGGGSTEPSCQVSAVTVAPTPLDLTVGETKNLTASISSANCDPVPTVSWSVDPPGAVTLQSNGNAATVTGVAPTASPVTVTATSGAATGTALVNVLSPSLINLAPSQLDFFSYVGGPDPQERQVTITNTGGGTLGGLSVGSIQYGAGGSGWITIASLSAPTASPSATLQVHAATGTLAAGVYTAVVPVQSASASNSPQQVAVTFTVSAENPCAVSSAVPIGIGDAVDGALAPGDCPLDDGSFLDAYVLTVASQVTLQVDMTSSAVDAYLILLDDTLGVVDQNDDRATGTTDAQLVDAFAPGTYYLLANSFGANEFGPYHLTVTSLAPSVGGARPLRTPSGGAARLERVRTLPAAKAAALRRLRRP